MKIVTSGSAYLDIDAYACCIAYAELLNQQGVEACAVSSAPFNASICSTVLSWNGALARHEPGPNDTFVLVDVSDPRHFDPIVVMDRVVEIIDHHPGFELHWAQRLGAKADIRSIGAAATQVFERWEASGLLPRISQQSAALLATAILDNTLNFNSAISTPGDADAYRVLATLAQLPGDWPAQYFLECQSSIESALTDALKADCKRLQVSRLPKVFAQLTVWDANGLLMRYHHTLIAWLKAQGGDSLVNLIGIVDGKSYFLADTQRSKDKLSRLISLCWEEDVAVVEPSLLRKELLALSRSADRQCPGG